MTQDATTFRALHEGPGAFVIPNPWDVGTARILAATGFPALATSSAGMAFALGLREGRATPEQMLAHCRMLVEATPLPVSAGAGSFTFAARAAGFAEIEDLVCGPDRLVP